jgi:heme/copper-type cytochrome/quinol oxidase subunit 4
MKSNAQRRAIFFIVLGLLGMAAYQMILHLKHPLFMSNDFIHGLWFGVFVGLEIVGLSLLYKNRRGA